MALLLSKAHVRHAQCSFPLLLPIMERRIMLLASTWPKKDKVPGFGGPEVSARGEAVLGQGQGAQSRLGLTFPGRPGGASEEMGFELNFAGRAGILKEEQEGPVSQGPACTVTWKQHGAPCVWGAAGGPGREGPGERGEH